MLCWLLPAYSMSLLLNTRFLNGIHGNVSWVPAKISSGWWKVSGRGEECCQEPVDVWGLSIPWVISACLSAFSSLLLSILPYLASVRDKLVTLCGCKGAVHLKTVRKQHWFFSFMRCYRKLVKQSYLLWQLLKFENSPLLKHSSEWCVIAGLLKLWVWWYSWISFKDLTVTWIS